MQTQRDQTGIISAATQTPLLSEGQLKVGLWLTGVGASHVWEVKEVDSAKLTLQKLPVGMINGGHSPGVDHTWTPAAGGGRSCPCGLREQPLKDFLPITAGKARIYLLDPGYRGLILTPQPGEFYAGMVGGAPVVITIRSQKWSQAIPIVPELHKVWGLPKELEGMINYHQSSDLEEAE